MTRVETDRRSGMGGLAILIASVVLVVYGAQLVGSTGSSDDKAPQSSAISKDAEAAVLIAKWRANEVPNPRMVLINYHIGQAPTAVPPPPTAVSLGNGWMQWRQPVPNYRHGTPLDVTIQIQRPRGQDLFALQPRVECTATANGVTDHHASQGEITCRVTG